MTPKTLNIDGKLVSLEIPKIMGIINVTPDSFYPGSRKTGAAEILYQAENMLGAGATLLDVGGYSSRPGATDIPTEEETARVVPAIREIKRHFPEAIVSVDTFRAEVARKAVESGAEMVNDISGGHLDAQMLKTVAQLKVPYIAMHMRGTPQTMKELTAYDDLIFDIMRYFSEIREQCKALGIHDLIIDPGFGFAKTPDQGYLLLKNLELFHHLDVPLLVGVSRKSMIYKILQTDPENALNGTTVLNTLALLRGTNILRVHDIKEAMEAVTLVEKVK